MDIKKPTRREFLFVSAASVAGIVLAACTTPAATTQAPGSTTAASSATDTPAAAPVNAADTPTPIAVQAATATTVPTTAAAQFKEAPALSDLVKAGKLPAVDQRLPKVPLTLAPIDSIGKYGGVMRSFSGGYTGYFDESQYGHSPLRWLDDGMAIGPGTCDVWSTNADNTVWTIHMREGLKWSDGEACTVDDVLFWWNSITQLTDPSGPDSLPDFGTDANGKAAKFEKKDDYTLTITYGTPSPLTAKRLAMWVNGNEGPRWIVPMHYIKQFVPKINPAVTDWKDFNLKCDVRVNTEMPSLNPWVLTKYTAGQSQVGTRNPYYYAVDTEGNQLPYIDEWDWTFIANGDPQVEILQIRQGSIDFQPNFHDYALGDVSTLKDNQDAGGYDVVLWDSGSGTAEMYFWNYDTADKKLRSLYRTPAFRQAMSFALDRPTIQHTVYYDTGILTTGTMSPKAYEFNFNADAQAYFKKARDMFVAYDPEKAKSMLDTLGCKVGTDGHRTYPDGTPLSISIDIQGDAGKEALAVLELAKKNWTDVGLNVVVNTVTPTAFAAQWWAGKLTLRTNWEVGDGPDHLLYPSWVVPNEDSRWAPLCGGVLRYAGSSLETTEADVDPWTRKPPRFNKNDADYKGTPIEKIHGLYAKAILEPDAAKRADLVYQMWDIHESDGPFFIGTVANYPQPIIVSRKLTNVPTHDQLKLGGFVNPWILPSPAITNPETYSYK
jgi:peptide/nickel transport system substrate-binding protein